MKEILLTRRSCASKVLAVMAFAAALCGGNYAYAAEASGGDSMALVAPNQTVSGVVVDAKG